MAIANGTAQLGAILNETNVFGWGAVIGIAIVFLSLLIITREPKQWSGLAFPVTFAWYLAGIRRDSNKTHKSRIHNILHRALHNGNASSRNKMADTHTCNMGSSKTNKKNGDRIKWEQAY